ncbi:hypothetical protein [Castellaniella sp. GW247-6E4]|uniref:hypothetical protein n=1 Tax=Castellaniella sp. GW247-6E4 TaxID=3140380 RepID=UPI003315BF72
MFDPQTGQFIEAPAPEHGWQAFADLLEAASPGVDTAIPLTPSQVTSHIAAMLDAGRAEAALDLIRKRQEQRENAGSLGTDVQLMYLHGRALAALGHHAEAIGVWRQMTVDFPELPEPWNALAIEYARQGQLDLAREALLTALVVNPDFAPALENLGHVDTRLAQRAFARARAVRGETGATRRPGTPGGGTPANAAQ